MGRTSASHSACWTGMVQGRRTASEQGELATYKPSVVQVTEAALGNSLGMYDELTSLSKIYDDSD